MENVNPIFLYLIAVFKFGVSAILAALIFFTPFILLYKIITFLFGPLDKIKFLGSNFAESFTFAALVSIMMGPLGLIAALMDDSGMYKNKRASILGSLTTNLLYAAIFTYVIITGV